MFKDLKEIALVFENREHLTITDLLDINFNFKGLTLDIWNRSNGKNKFTLNNSTWANFSFASISIKALAKYKRALLHQDIVWIQLLYGDKQLDIKTDWPENPPKNRYKWNFMNPYQETYLDDGYINIKWNQFPKIFPCENNTHDWEIKSSIRPEIFSYKECKICNYKMSTSLEWNGESL